MKPGEIYWVDLATGRRPSIVVSRGSLNQGNYVVMVLCTTRRFTIRSKLPNCVPFQAGEFGIRATASLFPEFSEVFYIY
jgi:mRNA-degrading endonuclease toxin of MazEF toxin-antitoxin module